MSEENEKLSHLIDEYSSDSANRQLLDNVLDDVNQQYSMRRYQMIGQVMRHELPEQVNTEFSHNVMARIQQISAAELSEDRSENTGQESNLESKSFWRWEWLKPIAGMAVAASVAVVSITLWQSVSVTTDSAASGNQVVSAEQQKIQQLASQPVQGAVNASSNLNNGMHWKVISDTPALERKLNGYLVNHTEYSRSMQGLIPQARVAGYGSEQ